MTGFETLRHQFGHELRRMRWATVLWIASLGFALVINVGPDLEAAQVLFRSVVALSTLDLIMLVIVALLLQHDPVRNPDAPWLTRPLSYRILVAAKALYVIVVLFVPAALAQTVALLHYGLPVTETVRVLMQSMLWGAVVVTAGAMLATVMTGLRMFLLAVLALFVLLPVALWLIGSASGVGDPADLWSVEPLAERWPIWITLAGLITGVGAVAIAYATRRLSRFLPVAGVAMLALAASSRVETWLVPGGDTGARGSEETRLGVSLAPSPDTQSSRVPAGHRAVFGEIRMEGGALLDHLAAQNVSNRIQFSDGFVWTSGGAESMMFMGSGWDERDLVMMREAADPAGRTHSPAVVRQVYEVAYLPDSLVQRYADDSVTVESAFEIWHGVVDALITVEAQPGASEQTGLTRVAVRHVRSDDRRVVLEWDFSRITPSLARVRGHTPQLLLLRNATRREAFRMRGSEGGTPGPVLPLVLSRPVSFTDRATTEGRYHPVSPRESNAMLGPGGWRPVGGPLTQDWLAEAELVIVSRKGPIVRSRTLIASGPLRSWLGEVRLRGAR